MAFKRKYPKPDVSEEDLNKLRIIMASTKLEKRKVTRASLILNDLLSDKNMHILWHNGPWNTFGEPPW